ncbi:hypothetical protein OJ996_24605 [Luteolibacter sp. GHJ8]|uniref:SMODS and SLOG-associating 2TM effector domain-containing protein n=1 Tax=Luteolibacter rhizosphaerae TaxID=2989719 RepID=A0ABT3GAD6_9BACT|nr:hypothetical protein [Luteolibacter rhizosphaerae]MCW1916792.1 hypothetical protein [Luteolibacter rhizosphaerae]
MKSLLKPLLFPNQDAADICLTAFADDQFTKLHESLKPFNRFSGWMLLVSGATVGLVASNFDKVGEKLPLSPAFLSCLAFSMAFGFIAKFQFVISDFMVFRMTPMGTGSFKWISEKESEIRGMIEALGDDEELIRSKLTQEALHRDFNERLPWYFRIGGPKSVAFGSTQRTKFFRDLTGRLVWANLLVFAQLGTLAYGIYSQVEAVKAALNS